MNGIMNILKIMEAFIAEKGEMMKMRMKLKSVIIPSPLVLRVESI